MQTWVVLLAAGKGSRLNAVTDQPKQFLSHHGAPLYWASARVFNAVARLRGVVFVVPEDRLENERAVIAGLAQHGLGLPWRVTAGSVERQDSVRNGLAALPPDCDTVLVHDAARPFVDAALVNRLLDALEAGKGAVIPAIPVVDTIKEAENNRVVATPDRSRLFAVQTPQGFVRAELEAAHARALAEQWHVTDDAALLERCGVSVRLVEGRADNLKITRPEDLHMLHTERPAPSLCTGLGYDVHRYAGAEPALDAKTRQPARPMRLGGVPIPGAPEVLAHSDGDVLLHALMDAALGLCGLGDIGSLFPDSDPALDNADSSLLLDRVLELLGQSHTRVTHVDCTLIAQIPKIAPWREQIQKNLCRLLNLPPDHVGLKATTEEHLGFTGEKKGIKAVVIATGERRGQE